MNNLEIYLQHIEDICGGEASYFKITDDEERPPISVISYTDVPEHVSITAFSFGLSSVPQSEWVNSRPELVISVNSLDTSWPIAMGELIRNGRGHCLFSYGMILNFGQPISDESTMCSFLVYACTVLDQKDLTVHLPDRKICLSQVYPIYDSEAEVIIDIGPERFLFDSGINIFDVKRAPYRGLQ